MIDGFLLALSPALLLMTLAGVCLGIIWGALPGLSTTMAMGLLIGLSAGMSQDVAISFMLGVYTGSVFGGAISAVLINIPGTPDAVPTMIEGHQLAQKGEGGQALGMAIASSFIGGGIGIILLVMFIPLILTFALNFKSWEMFWLAVIGIMVAGTMAAGSMPLKGWIAGWLGMLVAFVGLDSIHAVPRFTFGTFALFDGISYVAVLIGLFELAEILRTLPDKDLPTIPSKVGRVFPPFKLLAKYAPAAARSGILGTFIGAIPGAGANVASFLAYDIGRRRASPEERAQWGKGSYQALVCAETANNANIGGSMLPTLALGIPGNAAAAALLAALTLKNVVVGPTIELDHPGLIYFIYAALIVANISMYVAAFALIGPCVKLFSLPRGILMPLILPVCVIGAYAVKLSIFDVWIMFAAGVVGWLFSVFKFPVAPVVLGVILAPLADENFRRSLLIFEDKTLGFVLSQWIGTFLMLAVLFVVIEGALGWRATPEPQNKGMNMQERKQIGLAIVGCGTIGRIRAEIARAYPGIGWIGLCDLKSDIGGKLAEDIQADFFTKDYRELLRRPEVTATIIATDENFHFDPTMLAIEMGHKLFIEKPLATDARQSAEINVAITAGGIDAVVGYTNRFRRRFLAVKERLITGQIGDVHTVVTRAFMNKMVPIATVQRTQDRATLTPMVVSGTHSLDMSLWLMEGKTPVSVYAQSTDKVLGKWGTKDSTLGVFTMDDGTIFSMSISWGLPEVWPGAVYGIEIGIVGSEGVIDIEDTHRDLVMATNVAQGAGYAPEGYTAPARHVEFLTSYPPGDMHDGQLWGPMREETNSWYQRIYTGASTPHATAADGHKNLLMTMAMDLSAKRNAPVPLPPDPGELMDELT